MIPTVVNYLMRDDAYREAKQLELTIGDDSGRAVCFRSYACPDCLQLLALRSTGQHRPYPEQQALIDEMIQAYLP